MELWKTSIEATPVDLNTYIHFKLSLVKQLVKVLDFEKVFQEIHSMFPRLSDAKIKEEIFVGTQINSKV